MRDRTLDSPAARVIQPFLLAGSIHLIAFCSWKKDSKPWTGWRSASAARPGFGRHLPDRWARNHQPENTEHSRESGKAEREPYAEQLIVTSGKRLAMGRRGASKVTHLELDPDDGNPKCSGQDVQGDRGHNPALAERVPCLFRKRNSGDR